MPLPSGGLSASLVVSASFAQGVYQPPWWSRPPLGSLGVYQPPFWWVFQVGHQSNLESHTAGLHPSFETPKHRPFPQKLIFPQFVSYVFPQLLIFSIYIYTSIMSIITTGPDPALLMHSPFILFKKERLLDRRHQLPRWHQRQGSLRDMLWI